MIHPKAYCVDRCTTKPTVLKRDKYMKFGTCGVTEPRRSKPVSSKKKSIVARADYPPLRSLALDNSSSHEKRKTCYSRCYPLRGVRQKVTHELTGPTFPHHFRRSPQSPLKVFSPSPLESSSPGALRCSWMAPPLVETREYVVMKGEKNLAAKQDTWKEILHI